MQNASGGLDAQCQARADALGRATGRWSPLSAFLQTPAAPPHSPVNTVATVAQDAEQQVVVTVSWECPPELPGRQGEGHSALAMANRREVLNARRFAFFAAKRFLLRADAQQRADFLEAVASHSGTTTQCRGPAGALRRYVNR
eukprot:Skav213003  [mRNA]  locus=scaffold239:125712:132999:+ [translate_table: standard]